MAHCVTGQIPRDVVKTTIEHGAKVKAEDVDVLVEYLTKLSGRRY